MGKFPQTLITLVFAAHAAQADPRSEPARWLTDQGYAVGWECEQPYWGWNQASAKIAVVSALPQSQVSGTSDQLKACVEAGLKLFHFRRAIGQISGDTTKLHYTLHGPDGAVWFEHVFDFSG
ncbi:MAG: hypothetical protein ABJQ70_09835 [Roseobacter sp.]